MFFAVYNNCSSASLVKFYRIIEWIGLEGTLEITIRCLHGQGHLPLDQVSLSPIQSGLNTSR